MFFCIDLPTPASPMEELQASLRRLKSLPERDDPQVKWAIERVEGMIVESAKLHRLVPRPAV